MKKALLIGVAMLLVASAVSAGPDTGYIGLFADAGHSVCSVMGAGFTPFTMWIWCLDEQPGLTAVEFAVLFPPDVIASTTTLNPLITVSLGTLTGGTSVAFGTCQNDYVWTHQVACYLIDLNPNVIRIIADPTALPPAYLIATCDVGNPLIGPVIWSNLYLNQTCVIATQNASWGAIKSLF
jgi:hypothetical protein